MLVFDPVEGENQQGLRADGEDQAQAKIISDEKDVSKQDVPTLKR